LTGPRNILFVRLSAIGDVVNCLPALRLLKKHYPAARVTWAAEQPSASLLKGDPDIDEVFVVKRREWTYGLTSPANVAGMAAGFGYLRSRHFDVTLDFQGNLRSGVVTLASGARIKAGFTCGRVKEYSHLFCTRHVHLPRKGVHRIQRNLVLLTALGIEPEELPAELSVGENEAGTAGEFLREKGISGKQVVIVHPGVSKFGAFKQWSPERFGEVARRLADASRRAVIVSWGPGERELAEKVVELSGGKAILGPEPHGLRELAYLLGRSTMFVGGDTGPLHIAAAAGTPVVAIFGPKDPDMYGPAGNGHQVVRKEIECSPCVLRTCPDPRCMKLITVDEVYDACMRILG
jgi:heptosyltransferase-1